MQIKTYKGKRIEEKFYFFILNKGDNSGKPLTQACANCYLVIAETKEEKEFYYWLCYALWQSNKFYPCLSGSVISFLRIHDLKTIIKEAERVVKPKRHNFDRTIQILIKVDQHCTEVEKQLLLLKQSKLALLQKVFK